MELVILTGLSGAGKSTALRIIEDSGYYCVDNIPPILMSELVLAVASSKTMPHDKIAMVADIRAGEFLNGIFLSIEKVKQLGFDVRLVYLDSTDEVLVNRYNLTKRRHPLARDGSVLGGIQKEREALRELKCKSDVVIDTSNMQAKDFKEKVRQSITKDIDNVTSVRVVSFGYKRGIPMDLDFLFDVRFLPNPYYNAKLCEHNGLDADVKNYVFANAKNIDRITKIGEYVYDILKEYMTNSKDNITLGIACTGGKHRSVASAEIVANYLKSNKVNVTIEHRDIML